MPVLGVGEGDGHGGRERGSAVDDALVGGAAEGKMGGFLQQHVLLLVGPGGVVGERAGGAAAGFQDFIGPNPAVAGLFGRRNGVGVVPEIQAVDVLEVQPQPQVVRVVGGLAGAGRQREAAGDEGAVGGPQRVEHRLFQRVGVEEAGKELLTYEHVNLPGLGVGYQAHRPAALAPRSKPEEEGGDRVALAWQEVGNGNAPQPSARPVN